MSRVKIETWGNGPCAFGCVTKFITPDVDAAAQIIQKQLPWHTLPMGVDAPNRLCACINGCGGKATVVPDELG